MPTSSDGKCTAVANPAWAGVLLRCDVTSTVQNVTFRRTNPDGTTTTVRSGDNVISPGGKAVAYDHEPGLSGAAQYQVFDGTSWSTPVSATTAASDVAWVKSIRNPTLSRQVEIETLDEGYGADIALEQVLNSEFPAGFDNGGLGMKGTFGFNIPQADKPDLLRLLASPGPLLFQTTFTDLPASLWFTRGATSWRRVGMDASGVWHHVEVAFTAVARPTTVGWPMLMPGWSWADVMATYATGTGMAADNATWWDLLLRGIG